MIEVVQTWHSVISPSRTKFQYYNNLVSNSNPAKFRQNENLFRKHRFSNFKINSTKIKEQMKISYPSFLLCSIQAPYVCPIIQNAFLRYFCMAKIVLINITSIIYVIFIVHEKIHYSII